MTKSIAITSGLICLLAWNTRSIPFPPPMNIPVKPLKLSTHPGNGSLIEGDTKK